MINQSMHYVDVRSGPTESRDVGGRRRRRRNKNIFFFILHCLSNNTVAL